MLKLRLYIRSFQNLVRSTLKDPETLSEGLRGLPFCKFVLYSVVSNSMTLWTVACQAPLLHRIFQARILEWVAISSSRGSSWPWDRTHVSCVSCTAGGFFNPEPWGDPFWMSISFKQNNTSQDWIQKQWKMQLSSAKPNIKEIHQYVKQYNSSH